MGARAPAGRQKAQESIEKAVKQRVGGEYDGEQRGYRAWHKAIHGQFRRAGLEHLERNAAHARTGTVDLTADDWEKYYSTLAAAPCVAPGAAPGPVEKCPILPHVKS